MTGALPLLARVGPWSVLHRPGLTTDLVIACASVGQDATRAPAPEWVGSTRPHPALFVIDESRSWGTAPGLAEALTQALAALPPPHRILALGSSMGAVTALKISHLLELEALIALGPQHQPAAPWETRWRAHTARLPPLTAPEPRARTCLILHAGDDLTQAQGFRSGDRRIFPGQSHSGLALHLKPAMPGLIAAALDGDRRRLLRLVATAGGQRPKCFGEKFPPPAELP